MFYSPNRNEISDCYLPKVTVKCKEVRFWKERERQRESEGSRKDEGLCVFTFYVTQFLLTPALVTPCGQAVKFHELSAI